MATDSVHRRAWELARRQHWVIRADQLRAVGLTEAAIRHRVARGRLHALWPNTFAVGRPELSPEGTYLAAVFTCGKRAVLSHHSAAALWEIAVRHARKIEISIPYERRVCGRRGLEVHRRRNGPEVSLHKGVPVTTPAQTIIDLAPRLSQSALERMINEADKLDLLHPDQLRKAADGKPGAGAKRVRDLLDGHTFVVTDSELERLFVPLARRAGLAEPRTQVYVNGFKVDFYFPEIGLVVETDGGRFHRTPTQQTRDRLRDQAHFAARLVPLRFTHAQIKYDPEHVVTTLRAIATQSP